MNIYKPLQTAIQYTKYTGAAALIFISACKMENNREPGSTIDAYMESYTVTPGTGFNTKNLGIYLNSQSGQWTPKGTDKKMPAKLDFYDFGNTKSVDAIVIRTGDTPGKGIQLVMLNAASPDYDALKNNLGNRISQIDF